MCSTSKFVLFTLLFCFSLANDLTIDPLQDPTSNTVVSAQCKKFYTAIGNHDTSDPQIQRDETILMAYSGHNLNDLGNYKQCIKNDTFYHYLIIQITAQPQGFGYMGLCSPSYCSAEDWSGETTWLQNLIPTIGGPNLSNYTVNYIDPMDLGVEKDAVSILSFILVGALLVFAVVATFLTPEPEKNPKSQNPDSQLNGSTTFPLMAINRLSSEMSSVAEYENNREEPKKSVILRFIECFDLKRNFHELTGQDEKPNQDTNLKLWNGIRVISIAYVAFGSVFVLSSTNKNVAEAVVFAQTSWWFLIISASVYCIDLFFFISGFFAAYILLDKMKKMRMGIINFLKLYLYRWLRLWPTYVFVILLFWKVLPLMNTGPMWFQIVNSTKTCDQTWWKNFIFLDTAIVSETNEHCMIWGFYVSADFLLFLIVPPILLLYLKDREYAKTALWMLIIISIMGSYSFAIQANLPYSVQVNPPPNVNDIFNKVLLNPMVHWSTYYMGVYLGILYRNYKNGERNLYYSIQHSCWSGYVVSFIGTLFILFSVLIPRTEQTNAYIWPQSLAYLWTAAGRPFVVISVWFLLVPCLVNRVKPLRNFLSWGIFNILSNVVYCCYLIHFIVAGYIYNSDTQNSEFSLSKKIFLTITVLVLSFVIGSIIHLILEKPCIMLAKTFLSPVYKKNAFSMRVASENASITKT